MAARKAPQPPKPPPAREVALDLLDLDDKNPRMASLDAPPKTQDDLLKGLWKNFVVDEIALSIVANGFFRFEPLLAEQHGGRYTVIEGNRRLAAVRLLLSEEKRELVGATNLPPLPAGMKESLRTLPVIVCKRDEMWRYLGFRHINGPQEWDSESKAAYIAWVHNTQGVSLKVISDTIGDTHATVSRLYRTQMVLEQAERMKVFQKEDRYKGHFSFSHLSTGLSYEGIQEFLGIQKAREDEKDPVRPSKKKDLRDLLLWIYGSKALDKPPLVESQNPHLRQLDGVLRTEAGVEALRQGLPLQVAAEIAKGDELVFREALQSAKLDLQKALGTLPTGYRKPSGDALGVIEDVVKLAEKIHAEMRARGHEPKEKGKR